MNVGKLQMIKTVTIYKPIKRWKFKYSNWQYLKRNALVIRRFYKFISMIQYRRYNLWRLTEKRTDMNRKSIYFLRFRFISTKIE